MLGESAQDAVKVSVIVPVYCGADYLQDLCHALETVRQQWLAEAAPFQLAEVIFVNDNAIDNSGEIIDALAEAHPWVSAIHLSRNYGQHPATMQGVLRSTGDWIATLDEDLQHRPEHLTLMLRTAVSQRADIVYANGLSDIHQAAIRDLTSRSFKKFMEWITDNPHMTRFSSFRLIRGDMARAAASACSHDTFFDVTLGWFTQSVATVRVELKDDRYITTGQSGYNLRGLLAYAWRMLFSSQIKLLRIGAIFGLGSVAMSVFAAIYFFSVRVFFNANAEFEGWTSLFLATMFFGGLTAFMLGIALQYLSSMVLKAHGKPTFFTVDRSADGRVAYWFEQSLPQPTDRLSPQMGVHS